MLVAVVVAVVIAGIFVFALPYAVARWRSDDDDDDDDDATDELRELAAAMATHARQERAEMAAQADRIDELVQRGELEDADIALSHLLFPMLKPPLPAGLDLAAVRALATMAFAYADRDAGDDLERMLDAFEANAEKLGAQAAGLARRRLDELATALTRAGRDRPAAQARQVRDLLATRSPGSAT